MSLSKLTKFTAISGLVTLSNLLFIDLANAFSVTFDNGSFESDIVNSQNNWNTTGDVTIEPTIDGIAPTNESNQAIITTGYIDDTYTVDGVEVDRDDDPFDFNQSGNLPVTADTDPDKYTGSLQDHLSLTGDAFSIDRDNETLTGLGPRTSKEGSGMYQEFDVALGAGEDSFTVSFDWAYLTNDGTETTYGLGDQDFGFWSLGQYNSGTDTYTTAFNNSDEITVLQSSSGAITSPSANNDYSQEFNYATNGRTSYTVGGLTPNNTYTYRVGFGVVDVDSLDRTSALLIDNVQVIPFEFSPTLGILAVGILIGCDRLRRRFF